MATESIFSQRRPGYPRENVSASSYRTIIEYVGIAEDLRSASPDIGAIWGEYRGRVTDANLEPIEMTDYGILTVSVEAKFGSTDGSGGGGGGGGVGDGQGVGQEINEEIDWVTVSRPMYEHPAFRVGGGGAYELTEEDVSAIGFWQQEREPDFKKDYSYLSPPGASGPPRVLSDNAKMFAKGILQGIEYWADKAPVLRKSQTFLGGPGPITGCGQKESPTTSIGPPGYEWIKESDRSVRAGGQNSWRRDEEWLGAKKVLVDVDEVFWTPPA